MSMLTQRQYLTQLRVKIADLLDASTDSADLCNDWDVEAGRLQQQLELVLRSIDLELD